jgi:hypothetical protein
MGPKLERARKIFGTAQTKMVGCEKSNSFKPALGEIKLGEAICRLHNGNRVGLVGHDMVDMEVERVEGNDGWRRELFL